MRVGCCHSNLKRSGTWPVAGEGLLASPKAVVSTANGPALSISVMLCATTGSFSMSRMRTEPPVHAGVPGVPGCFIELTQELRARGAA